MIAHSLSAGKATSPVPFRVVGLGLAALWVLVVLSACGQTAANEPAAKEAKLPPLVTVQRLEAKPIQNAVELTGEVVSLTTVTLSPTVEGTIRFCPWREGDRVSAGEKLVEIDRQTSQDDVRAAEASLAVAKAKLDDMKAGSRPEEVAKAQEAVKQAEESAGFAKTDLDRVAKLVQSGALAGETLEKARVAQVSEQSRLATARRQAEMVQAGFTKTALAVQEAAVREAQSRVDLARSRLAESILRAPFAGTITKVHARAGDTASVKMPLLELSSLASPVVRFAVPEAHAAALRVGMSTEIRLDGYPGKAFPGRVSRVFPDLDRRMRTRTAEASLQGGASLLPGMFARLRLILASVPDALVVPAQAVLTSPSGERFVFVADQGKAARRLVRLGIDGGEVVQILEGVAVGDAVVVAGHKKLKEGVPIREAPPEAKGKDQAKGQG